MMNGKKKYIAPKYDVVRFDNSMQTWISWSTCRQVVAYLREVTDECKYDIDWATSPTIISTGYNYED